MKVVCIDSNSQDITIGKIYDTLDQFSDDDKYIVYNDIDHLQFVPKIYFKTPSEIREERINEILKK